MPLAFPIPMVLTPERPETRLPAPVEVAETVNRSGVEPEAVHWLRRLSGDQMTTDQFRPIQPIPQGFADYLDYCHLGLVASSENGSHRAAG